MQILNEMKTKFSNIGLSDVKKAFEFTVYFKWTTHLLSWVITSAGIMSECAFMVAALWMSINANVHPYVLQHMTQAQSEHYNYLATIAFIALPELILVLSIQTTIGHVSTVVYYWHKKESFWPWVWTILFGIPTLLFLILSVVTVLNMVNNHSFVMPMWLQQIRALSAYVYALSSLLYVHIGKKQEKHWLAKKDELYSALQAENKAMSAKFEQHSADIHQSYAAEIADIQSKYDSVYSQLQAAIHDKKTLNTALMQSAKSALQAWPQDVIDWVNSLNTSVHIDDIAARTGINKRTLKTALERKELQVKGTNPNLIWVPTVREYLEKHPPKTEKKERDTGPIQQVVNE